MDIPLYLRALWSQKWLLLVGVIAAAAAGLFAGFTIEDGQLEQRGTPVYSASTTLLLSNPSRPLGQAELPVEWESGQVTLVSNDLPALAIAYAYLISGDDVRHQVEEEIGAFRDGDSLTAVRRTSQPAAGESEPGAWQLPVVEVFSTSVDPGRAEEIAGTAAEAFIAGLTSEQQAAGIPANWRVSVDVIGQDQAEQTQSGSPVMSVAVTAAGVMLAAIVLALIVYNARTRGLKPAEDTEVTQEPDASETEGGGDEHGHSGDYHG